MSVEQKEMEEKVIEVEEPSELVLSLRAKYGSANVVCPQRSIEWHLLRTKGVGASEVYDFVNKFSSFHKRKSQRPDGFSLGSMKSLSVAQRAAKVHANNAKNFFGKYGQLFEEVAKAILIEEYELLGGKFLEVTSVRHPTMECLSASADGLVILKNGEVRTVEIKCPIYNSVTKVPPKYLYQIEQQLMCLPEAKSCDYHAFQFRVCSKYQLFTPQFNRYYHRAKQEKYPPSKVVLLSGIIEVKDGLAQDYGRIKYDPTTRKPLYRLAKFADIKEYSIHIFKGRPESYDFLKLLDHWSSSYFCFNLYKKFSCNVPPDPSIRARIEAAYKSHVASGTLKSTLSEAKKAVTEWALEQKGGAKVLKQEK